MQHQPNHVLLDDERQLQRLIVLQLLRDDRDERWSRRELALTLLHAGAHALADAVASLKKAGVVGGDEESVWASQAARRLDDLHLICV